MSAQLVLLLTSPRVAPGLLSRAGWQALESAEAVLCTDAADELPTAVADAGLAVTELAGPAEADPPARARELVRRAASGSVVWLGSPDGDPGLTDALAAELSRVATTDPQGPPPVEVLVASHDLPGARLLDLVAVMDRLRSPGGCPWDADQTPASLVPYLVEEAYEAVEAIEAADGAAVREELGDVLLQVVFHARMAAEPGAYPGIEPFDVDDVAAGIVAKLVRRHPHVFAPDDEGGLSADDVQQRWDRLKAEEKGRASVLDGIPAALPALARAEKVVGRIERDGGRRPGEPLESVGDPLADALLAVVAQARAEGRDPEEALRSGVRELERRHREQERREQERA